MKGLLVTGGTGLLGTALKEFCPEATFVSSADYDLRDISQTKKMFQDVRPVVVFHLAAKVGGVKKNALYNADLMTENLQINSNVLSIAAQSGVQKLFSFLSSCAFATYPNRPSTENDLHIGMPFEGNQGYGWSKRVLDLHTQLISKQYHVAYSTITPVTMYGPGDNWDLDGGHVVASLIRKSLKAREDGTDLEIWGSGEAIRQFIFVKDVARFLLSSIDINKGSQTMIVAADGGISIKELASTIANVVGFQGRLLFDVNKPEGQKVKVLRSERFEKFFSNFQFTPLTQGLQETVAQIQYKRPW